MNFLVDTAAFVFALGVIVFVHEAGHFLVAKAFDVRVLTFSLGFGRRIWGFTRGETEYRVSWLPLGGYVRLGGENPEEATGDPQDFQSKPRWQRVLVYLAGPAMNVVLAVFLVAIVFMVGDVPYLQDIPPVVGEVVAGSPAAAAGIAPGDQVVSIKGQKVESWQQVAVAIMESPESPVSMVVKRKGKQLDFTVTPDKVTKYEFGDAGVYPRILPKISMVNPGSPAAAAGLRDGDQIRSVDRRPVTTLDGFVKYIQQHPGEEIVVEVERDGHALDVPVVPAREGDQGRIGVALTVAQRFGPARAFVESVKYNWNVSVQTLALVGKLVRHEVKARNALHGPLDIATLSGEAARQGLPSLLHLMGLVSISIAIFNLLPIPVLDGGQIFIILVEAAMRRDLSLRIKEAVNLVGLALVMLLMVVVLGFDISRNLSHHEAPPAKAPAAAPSTPSAAPAP